MNQTNPEIPLGLGMALSRNMEAMRYFSALSSDQQQRVIDGAAQIGSKEDMRAYVKTISEKF